ncbi:MAG: pyruvate kinase, partial [Armatimonadetes bacterium]|nr:pyruvate kinase [Armatimonadota bacterium]
KKNSKISIISKIEKHEAIKNIDEIIQISDAIMVARGDLGIELSLEEVPFWQKEIIKRCNFYSKPVITATQMLESMINNFRPTRAEVADIANAIIDGTDALMLSGETAKGKYPLETVKIMHKTALITEKTLNYEKILTQKVSNKNVSEAISLATCEISEISNANAILTFTSSGRTAKKISRYKPRAIILAAVNSEDVQRQLNLSWGVYSFLAPRAENSDELIKKTVQKIQKENLIKPGDLMVITAGIPPGVPGSTNMIKLHVVGHIFLRGMGAGEKSIISGRTCILKNFENLYSQVEEGDILVIPYLDKKLEAIMSKIKGAVIQAQETSSQISLIEKYNLGAVFGVPDAMEVFKDGRIITLDIVRGLIYGAD